MSYRQRYIPEHWRHDPTLRDFYGKVVENSDPFWGINKTRYDNYINFRT